MNNVSPPSAPLEPALISHCELVLYELDTTRGQAAINHTFGEVEKMWGDGVSPFQQWYRTSASLSANPAGRHIAWKSGKSFKPEHLFFRTVDTGRLLPMHLAMFRLQFYAHKSHWGTLDAKGERDRWINNALLGLMHEILLMRNMHDSGGGDIPILVTAWEEHTMSAAMDYWVELSKGEWSEAERNRKFSQCANGYCRRLQPRFEQADLLVRSLFADPAVGYIPPFIIVLSFNGPRARALFSHPSHVPPPALTQFWPKSCGASGCKDPDCGNLRFELCRTLHAGSAMVRESPWPEKRIACNLWGCEVLYRPGEAALMRCQKCKEVIYCSREHQLLDWGQHRNVCEPQPAPTWLAT